MSIEQNLIDRLAGNLLKAEQQRNEIKRLTIDHPDLDIHDAYAIMSRLISMKQELGKVIIGYKLGYTSRAMQEQMGVAQPIYGILFDDMMMNSGDQLVVEELIHPKLEAEIAFVFKQDLIGPRITREHVLEASDYILPVLEVVDSRYLNYRFTMVDVISDNNSGARVIAGKSKFNVSDINLPESRVSLKQNNKTVQTGSGSDVLGNPADAIVWLVNFMHEHGRKIHAGDIVLSGGMTRAINLRKNDSIEADFGELGTIHIEIV